MSRSIAITIPAAKVPTDLDGFPLFIDLADLDAEFWDFVTEDGHDIRLKDAGENNLPFDLIYFVREEQIGALRVKVDLSSTTDTTVTIWYDDPNLPWVLPTDSNGRNAVYTGFHRVVSFLDSLFDRTGSGNKMEYDDSYLPLLNASNLTTDVGCHQGMIFDYEHNAFIAIDTNLLKRYEYSGGTWNLVATNTDPCGDAGTVDHCGSGFLKDGKIYIPQTVSYTTSKLSEYDATTLEFIRTRTLLNSLGNPADYTASCCWVPALNKIVFGSYAGDGSKLYTHLDDDELSYSSTISLSTAVTLIQGIAWWRGAFWVSSDADSFLYRISIDGTEVNQAWELTSYTYIEGLSAGGNALYIIGSNAVGHGIPIKLQPWTKYGPAHGLYNPNANSVHMSIACTRYTQWTLGLTARITARTLTQTQIFCNYQMKDSDDSTKRASLGFGSVKGQIGAWNSDDAWQYRNPLLDAEYSGLDFCSNFSEDTTGVAPTGWTEEWNPTRASFTVENTGQYGRNCLYYSSSTTGYRYALSLDSPASVSDGEVLASMKVNGDTDHIMRVYVRGGGSAGAENCYFAYIQPIGHTIGIQKYVAGTSTNVGTTAKTIDTDTYYYLRFRFVGSALKAKAWPVGTAEPEAWDLELTDTALTAGWVGIGASTGSGAAHTFYDYFALSTGANPATVPLCKDDTEITNHVAVSHNGTTARTLYHNGTPYLDAGCTEKPSADSDVVSFGAPYGINQAMTGMIEWFWLAASVLSDEWLETDYENVMNHATFYTIGEGEVTPDLTGNAQDTLAKIDDQPSYALQPYLERDLTDELQAITDTISAILSTSRVEAVGDELKVILDEPSAILEPGLAGVAEDTLEVIRDSVSYGLINLTQPHRWVAPTTITPKTTLIDPLHLAAHPVRHPTLYFEPRVKSYGSFTRAISAPAGFIKTGDVTLSVADPDNVLRRKIAAKTIKKATVDMRLGPEGGSYRSFLRAWKRRVYSVTQPSDGLLNFHLKDNMFDMLDASFPTVITADNFPNLPPNIQTNWANHVIGVVSSTYGAVPCPLVDTTLNQYLANIYISKSVDGVYRRVSSPEPGGAEFELVSPSEYTVVQTKFLDHFDGGGLYCTLIQFNTSQGDTEIRANISGIYDEDTGELLYTNFADYLLGIFQYLVGVNNRTDILNLASFEETRAKVAHLTCAGAVTSKLTFGEWITRLQRSSNIDVFADKNDRIAIHYTGDEDQPTIDLDHIKHFYGGSVSQQMADPVYNRFMYKYAPNYAAGSWTDGVFDNEEDQVAVDGEIMEDPEEIQLFFVRDATTAESVMNHRASYCRLESFKFQATIPMIPVLEELELGDLVRITHFGGLAPAGYSNKQFKITKLVMDVDKLSYQLEGIVRKLAPPTSVITNNDDTGSGGSDEDDSTETRRGLSEAAGGVSYNCRCGPWSNGIEGEYFALFRDGRDSSRLLMCRTTNYGLSWYVSDDANAPDFTGAQGGLMSFDACKNDALDDHKIHTACQAWYGRVLYSAFDMTTNTWGPIEVVTPSQNIIGSAAVSIECRYPGGEPLIFFAGDRRPGTLNPTALRSRAYYSMRTAGSWDGPIQVTPDGLTYSFWSFGAMETDCACRVERVVAGRDNRMHFFFKTDQGSQEYYITMQGSRTLSQPPIRYVWGYTSAPHNVNALIFKDRTRIALFMRREDHMRARIMTEGSSLSIMASNNVSEQVAYPDNRWLTAPSTTGSYNPPGFYGYDANSRKLYCVLGQKFPYGKLRIMESTNDGLTWSESKAADPTGGIYVVTGNIITVGREAYLATFGTEDGGGSGGWPRWIWKKISTLT